jgi:hypothetical protein
MQTANDNYRAKTQGEAYYPEMGERHDGTALFERQVGYGGYYLKWSVENHERTLEVFKRLRIRPRYMEQSVGIKRGLYWSCGVTWAAGNKLGPYSITELLLD